MNNNLKILPCPLCSTDHIVPVSRNRSKCRGCMKWLQINDIGDALQEFYKARDDAHLKKYGKPRVRQIKVDTSNIQW